MKNGPRTGRFRKEREPPDRRISKTRTRANTTSTEPRIRTKTEDREEHVMTHARVEVHCKHSPTSKNVCAKCRKTQPGISTHERFPKQTKLTAKEPAEAHQHVYAPATRAPPPTPPGKQAHRHVCCACTTRVVNAAVSPNKVPSLATSCSFLET